MYLLEANCHKYLSKKSRGKGGGGLEGTLFNTEGFYLPLISTDSWLPEKSSQNGGVKEVLKPAPEAVVAPEVVAPVTTSAA